MIGALLSSEPIPMSQITIGDALANAISAHKLGNLAEAERLYRLVIKSEPKHSVSNHNLGILLIQNGTAAQSLEFFKKAVEAAPTELQYWMSYLDALLMVGNIQEAYNLLEWTKSKELSQEKLSELQRKILSAVQNNSGMSCEPPKEIILPVIKLLNEKKFRTVLSKISTLSTSYPKSAILNNIAGVASAKSSQYDTAIKYYKKALELNPGSGEVLNNLGNAYTDLELKDEAISSYIKAIENEPTLVEAHFNLGNMLTKVEKFGDAIIKFKAAIRLRANYPEAYLALANAEKRLHNHSAAEENYKVAIELSPRYLEAYVNLASLYLEINRIELAHDFCLKAIKLAPTSPAALNNLGLSKKELGEYEEAEKYYKKAIVNKPNFHEAYNNFAALLRELGRHAEAKYNLERALEIQPEYTEALKNYGVVCQDLGERKLAVDFFKKAIAKKPSYSEAHRHLSILINYKEEEVHLSQMEDQLRTATLTDLETSQMKYAVAKAYEDLGDLDKAFSNYTEAGKIRKNYFNYKIEQERVHFRDIKKAQINLSALSSSKELNNNSIIPIFIVGMPRSGTSLVEQIISCHSAVHGAGELDYLARLSRPILERQGNNDSKMLLGIRKQYLKKLDALGSGQNYVTDKMPENYKLIPIIASAFPEAKIVHVRRSPEATCWSNFKHYFVSNGMRYSYDINDVVEAYLLYHGLMSDWEEKYPNKIISCDYDALTENQEMETRRLIDSLGLPWQQKCLSPHKNKRFVNTASQHQVRKKVYKKSSVEWIKFSALIGASFKQLDGIK